MSGRYNEADRSHYEALRCRSITEVRVSSVWGNRAETSGFYGADFISGFETSAEPECSLARATLSTHVKRGRGCVHTKKTP